MFVCIYINDFDVRQNYICENYIIAKRSNIVESNAYVYNTNQKKIAICKN